MSDESTQTQQGATGRPDDDRLVSWKRIATYLNRNVRTLRRWERNEGLPVHRLMHEKLPTVYAYKSELDAWWEGREQQAASQSLLKQHTSWTRPYLLWLVLVAAVSVAGLSWLLLRNGDIAFETWDWVLITRFENRTGETVLDGTLEYALERELGNSSYVKVVPRERVNDALRLMKVTPDTPIDEHIGREISLRDGAIRVLIMGRIEKLGDTYALSVALMNPADGVKLAGFAAEASGQTEILPRVAQLARDVRQALGEEVSSIRQSEKALAKVTTPSLEALKLYSEAEAMMAGGPQRKRALPLLEQAVRIDPDFASAHLLLWYLLWEHDRQEQAEMHLERAMELADSTSERERLFILATYYGGYLQDQQKAIETYKFLIRLYPDHVWAWGNLSVIYRLLGQPSQAAPYQFRSADLRPNLGRPQLDAARTALILGDAESAKVYIARARALAEFDPWLEAELQVWPIAELWIEGNYRAAAEALDELVGEVGATELAQNRPLFVEVCSLYLALGRLEKFETLSKKNPDADFLQVFLDLGSPRKESLNAYLDRIRVSYFKAVLLVRAMRLQEAIEAVENPLAAENEPPPYAFWLDKKLARGELALAQGRPEDAVRLLEEANQWGVVLPNVPYFLGVNSLARAQEMLDRRQDAIATLESAEATKAMSIFDQGAAHFWIETRVYLMDLYDQSGRQTSADRIEVELRDLLQVADRNHPVLVKLDQRAAQ